MKQWKCILENDVPGIWTSSTKAKVSLVWLSKSMALDLQSKGKREREESIEGIKFQKAVGSQKGL